MGFLSKLGKTLFSSAVNTVKTSFMSNLTNAISSSVFGDKLSGNINTQSYDASLEFFGNTKHFTTNYTSPIKHTIETDEHLDPQSGYNAGIYKANKVKVIGTSKQNPDTTNDEWHSGLYLPEYGYDILLNERTMFQKGLYNFFGEPGFFYFKIFFKFDTQYGLLGGILNNDDPLVSINSAASYLATLGNSTKSNVALADERLAALFKFTKTLSYINCNAPWFFKSVKGLDKAGVPKINEFSKDNIIELECNVDAIDMRLTTLIDLYKFICYDPNFGREIVPENLRKFDMLVMIFQSPIRTLHSAIKKGGTMYNMPSTRSSHKDSLMSFKLFEFLNCEFDVNSLGSMIPGDVNNEQPFNLGKSTLRIKYTSCNQHLSNEFEQILFGNNGIFYDYDSSIKSNSLGDDVYKHQMRINALTRNFSGRTDIVDYGESYTVNNLTKLSRFALGNIYGEYQTSVKYSDTNPDPQTNNNYTDFKKAQIYRDLHKTTQLQKLQEIGINWLSNILGMKWQGKNSLGYLSGYEESGPGSPMWIDQIQKLTSRFQHQYTAKPSDKYIVEYDTPDNAYGRYATYGAAQGKSLSQIIYEQSLKNIVPDNQEYKFTTGKPNDYVDNYYSQYYHNYVPTRKGLVSPPTNNNTNHKSTRSIIDNTVNQYNEWLSFIDDLTSKHDHQYTTKPYQKKEEA